VGALVSPGENDSLLTYPPQDSKVSLAINVGSLPPPWQAALRGNLSRGTLVRHRDEWYEATNGAPGSIRLPGVPQTQTWAGLSSTLGSLLPFETIAAETPRPPDQSRKGWHAAVWPRIRREHGTTRSDTDATRRAAVTHTIVGLAREMLSASGNGRTLASCVRVVLAACSLGGPVHLKSAGALHGR